MKPWQHGYPLDMLDGYVDRFARHDDGYCLAAMTAVNRRTVADWLHRRVIYSLGESSVIMRTTTQAQQIIDFTGKVRTVVPKHALAVDRIAGNSSDILTMLGETVRRVGVVQLTGWVDDVELNKIALALGLHRAATKIRATSEVVAVWTNTTADKLPSYEQTGITRLDLPTLDVTAAALEAQQLTDWTEHYSNYNVKGSWHALSLRGFSEDPAFVEKPAEMTRAWRRDNPDTLDAHVVDTPLSDALPAVRALADQLPGGTPQRIRLMRLDNAGMLSRHSDISDRQAGCRTGKLARLHIPLTTNPTVKFTWWDINNTAWNHTMKLGETWYIDQRKPHQASNDSDDRIHLVVDVTATEQIRQLLS